MVRIGVLRLQELVESLMSEQKTRLRSTAVRGARFVSVDQLPRPQPVSNDLFIELRYSLPPSLIVHFDFSDLALGIFRAFALPLKEGEAMLRLLSRCRGRPASTWRRPTLIMHFTA